MSLQNKFADNDPYVQTQQTLVANNNNASFNVAIAEANHLRGTSAAFAEQAITRTPANPFPTVAVTGQNTIGAALGDIGQAGTASQTPGGGGNPPCFIGNTLFSMWREPWSRENPTIHFSALYQTFHQRKPPYGGGKEAKDFYRHREFFAFSYDDNNPVKGKILDVTRTLVYEYLHVTFQDGGEIAGYDEPATGVTAEHPYFTPNGYMPIKDLLGQSVVHEETWRKYIVKSIDEVKVPKGIYVYNAHIDTYQNYCANGHRVHNLCPLVDPHEPPI